MAGPKAIRRCREATDHSHPRAYAAGPLWRCPPCRRPVCDIGQRGRCSCHLTPTQQNPDLSARHRIRPTKKARPRIAPGPLTAAGVHPASNRYPQLRTLLKQIATSPRLNRCTWDLSLHLPERGTSLFLTASARSIARSASAKASAFVAAWPVVGGFVRTMFFLLVGVSRLSGDRRAAPRTGGLRLIWVGVAAVAEGRVAETIAADTGRCRLALRHAIKAAAPHMPSDILTAKLGSTCLRGAHCTKGNRRE